MEKYALMAAAFGALAITAASGLLIIPALRRLHFGQTIKENRLATIVGQTSGGNQRGINGGAFFFLRLPGSGLEVDLPLIGRFPTTPQPDAGVEPDIAVRPTAAAIAEGRDLEMAAVMAALG